MKINCGIIGLPNVGKSTLFKSLTNIPVKIANFPFCTITPNVAVTPIYDSRLNQLQHITKAREIVYGTIEFIDIAGLIRGASQGEGLGNKILQNIQSVKVLCHVVRCFTNDVIFHIDNNIDPCRDANTVNTELILFDIEQCQKNISFLKNNRSFTKKYIDQMITILQKCLDILYKGMLLRQLKFSIIETKTIQKFNFLTFKPVIYVANVDVNHTTNNIYYNKLNILGSQEYAPVVSYCYDWNGYDTKNNSSLCYNQHILGMLTQHILKLLKLNTFFTVNAKMVRAWINMAGFTALDAASDVHSDFKKGFIRVQVIKFDDFICNNGELGSKKFGKVHYEGRQYLVKDGDILKFLFQKK